MFACVYLAVALVSRLCSFSSCLTVSLVSSLTKAQQKLSSPLYLSLSRSPSRLDSILPPNIIQYKTQPVLQQLNRRQSVCQHPSPIRSSCSYFGENLLKENRLSAFALVADACKHPPSLRPLCSSSRLPSDSLLILQTCARESR